MAKPDGTGSETRYLIAAVSARLIMSQDYRNSRRRNLPRRGKRSYLEICSPTFLADPVAPDELKRISRSEESVSDDEQMYLIYAYRSWMANGEHWTFALAHALTWDCYMILKKCEYRDEFVEIVRSGRFRSDDTSRFDSTGGTEEDVAAFFSRVEAMEACPEAYEGASSEPSEPPSVLDSIPQILIEHLPIEVLGKYLDRGDGTDHGGRHPIDPYRTDRILRALRGWDDDDENENYADDPGT